MISDAQADKSKIQNTYFREAGDDDMAAGRAGTQGGWYEFASTFSRGQEVLDVGCGLGKGLQVLKQTAASARGIDRDARLVNEMIADRDIADEPDNSVDAIVCIDVIEHVEDDHEFIDNLARVARKQILLSTPNYTASRCKWPYHVREYMPHELYDLFSAKGMVKLYIGPQYGDKRSLVNHYPFFVLINKLRVNRLTGLPTRVFNKLLPDTMRIQSHLFIRVLLDE